MRVREALRGLTRTDWAFVHFKAALGLLWLIPLTKSPAVQGHAPLWFILAWMALFILGFIVSLVGLVMSAQTFQTRRCGFVVEMTGLVLLMSGPAIYGLFQIGLALTTSTDRSTAIALAYIICAALLTRMVMIKAAAKSRTVIYRYTESADDD
ncbi:hypothetical protein PP353_gp21 [Arthrobacter phage Kumotta]|uniref:Uncharacterized protein n=2 Tax=Kumottavirus TaxID=3044749 RepID=A0A4Y6EPP8_9CAUD|nr:hypothetical protein PP353_gp21 [Arthrobacter phage Kumotta]YP_010649503.1 hypothetical protein PP356_gp21 [Arthrobacter phage MargaretKali]AXH44401.1 hypothetical protein SEA_MARGARETKALI_21 [Arthrobacter phage MargaretKali]QDF19531.1 hypothetical protein SEA_KUMOTTA_21 [Arthrobacter phage Kumotta]